MQQFKSDHAFGSTILKVVVIKHEVKALVLLFAHGKRGTLAIRCSEQNANPTVLLGRLFLQLNNYFTL